MKKYSKCEAFFFGKNVISFIKNITRVRNYL